MYQGFNLELDGVLWDDQDFAYGQLLHAEQRKQVRASISAFAGHDGVPDASKMQANWFPQIDAQVFISHSHADEADAIALAGWLKSRLTLFHLLTPAPGAMQMIYSHWLINSSAETRMHGRIAT